MKLVHDLEVDLVGNMRELWIAWLIDNFGKTISQLKDLVNDVGLLASRAPSMSDE